MVFGDRAFGRWWGHEGEPSQTRFVPSQEKTQRGSLFAMWGYSKTAICKLGKGPSMRHQICQHLDPGLPASRTVRNTGLLVKLPGLWCLLPHQSWLAATSTPLSRWSLWPFSLSFLTHRASYLCLYNQHSTSGAEGPREWQGWRRHSEPVANERGPNPSGGWKEPGVMSHPDRSVRGADTGRTLTLVSTYLRAPRQVLYLKFLPKTHTVESKTLGSQREENLPPKVWQKVHLLLKCQC